MKAFFVIVIFACLAFPVFSEDSNLPRYQSLSETMGRTISSANSKLENYTQDSENSANMKTYAAYKGKYDSVTRRMGETETKLDLLIRTNDRTVDIKKERDHYEYLIQELDTVKSDYDSWMKNVK